MGEKISYKGWQYQIFSDGYELWNGNDCHVTQHAPYDKMFVPDGSYEDNAKAQIDDLTTPAPPTEEEKIKADLDYIAVMEDLILPSQENE